MRPAKLLHRVSLAPFVVMFVLLTSGSVALGADAVSLLDKFLDSSSKASGKKSSTPIQVPRGPAKIAKPATQTITPSQIKQAKKTVATQRDTVRVAQRRAVLRLSDENSAPSVSDISPVPDVVGDVVDGKSEAELSAAAKRAESAIDRKMQSLQRSLEREEKQLGTRLSELNRQREQALEKSDEKRLKRIETLEKNAVGDYDRKVQRILAAMSAPQESARPAAIQRAVGSQRSAVGSSPRAVSKPVGSSVRRPPPSLRVPQPKPQARSQPKPQPKPQAPQRRRFRLWPFK